MGVIWEGGGRFRSRSVVGKSYAPGPGSVATSSLRLPSLGALDTKPEPYPFTEYDVPDL